MPSPPFIIFRFYGNYQARFKKADSTEAVCDEFMAECFTLVKDQCQLMPDYVTAPYTHVWHHNKQQAGSIDEPYPETPGRYMILTVKRAGRFGHGAFTLFSNCTEDCIHCFAGTGLAYRPIDENEKTCVRSAPGSIYQFAPPELKGGKWLSGTSKTNCVKSLEDYWEGVREAEMRRTIFFICGMLFLICILMCLCAFVYRWKRNWNRRVRDRFGSTEDIIAQIQSQTIGSSQIAASFPIEVGLQDETQCVVCLSPIMPTQPFRILQCFHYFHADCIVQWWVHEEREELECPVCKQVQTGLAPPADLRQMVEEATEKATGRPSRTSKRSNASQLQAAAQAGPSQMDIANAPAVDVRL